MFITPAYAQAAATVSTTNDMLIQILPFVLIFFVFYFLLLRPQQARVKQQKVMLDNLQRGQQVVTAGGLIGKVHKIVDDKEVLVELADNVHVRVLRATIASLHGDSDTEQTVAKDK